MKLPLSCKTIASIVYVICSFSAFCVLPRKKRMFICLEHICIIHGFMKRAAGAALHATDSISSLCLWSYVLHVNDNEQKRRIFCAMEKNGKPVFISHRPKNKEPKIPLADPSLIYANRKKCKAYECECVHTMRAARNTQVHIGFSRVWYLNALLLVIRCENGDVWRRRWW